MKSSKEIFKRSRAAYERAECFLADQMKKDSNEVDVMYALKKEISKHLSYDIKSEYLYDMIRYNKNKMN